MTHVHELLDLTGHVAVVTGGGTGLGLQMATGLAEAGATVVLCGRRPERCQAAADALAAGGLRALALACDVTDPDSVEAMVAATLEACGRIDILVNNAGMAWAGSPLDLPDDLKGAVVYLASAAADFVTGHVLVVDGGAVAW